MKIYGWIVLLLLIACAEKEKASVNTLNITTSVYSGFMGAPDCQLFDEQLQPLVSTRQSADGTFIVPATKKELWLVARCASRQSDTPFVMHGAAYFVEGSELNIIVNPLTELAYRQAKNDLSTFATQLERVFLSVSLLINDPLSVVPIFPETNQPIDSLYVAILEMLKSTAQPDLSSKVDIILLNDRLTLIENAMFQNRSLSSVFTAKEIAAFIASANLSQELINFLQDNFVTKLPQDTFDFDTKNVQQFFSRQSFTQAVEGGAGVGEITYRSSDPKIASVYDAGQVFFHRSGTVTITAMISETDLYESAEASYELRIMPDRKGQTDFVFTQTKLSRPFSDSEVTFAVSGGKGEGLVYYTSSDTDIAEVTSTGKVLFHDIGKVTITAHIGGDVSYYPAQSRYDLTISGLRVDQASGGQQTYATLAEAVSALKAGDTLLMSGHYPLAEALDLSTLKGTSENKITLKSATPFAAVLSGLVPLSELTQAAWEPVDQALLAACDANCFKITIDKPLFGLQIDGKLLRTAAWPDYESASLFNSSSVNEHSTEHVGQDFWHDHTWADATLEASESIAQGYRLSLIINDSRLASVNLNNLERETVYIRQGESDFLQATVTGYDTSQGLLTVESDRLLTGVGKIGLRLEGLSTMDQSGEYVYDRESQTLWLYLEEGVTPDQLNIQGWVNPIAMELSQAEHLDIADVQFEYQSVFCEAAQCGDNQLMNNLIINPVPASAKLAQLSGKAVQVLPNKSLASLVQPHYWASKNNDWANASAPVVTTAISQPYEQMPVFPFNLALKPLSVVSGDKRLVRWQAPQDFQLSEALLGGDMLTLAPLCDAQSVTSVEGVSQCTLPESVKGNGDPYWLQVKGAYKGQVIQSPVWSLSLPPSDN